MKIEKINKQNFKAWLEMALSLWPESSEKELRKEFRTIFSRDKKIFLCKKGAENYVGFVYTSIRKDYVSGSSTSPVGYIEGIYVKPGYRRTGIGKILFGCAEKWIKSKCCKEIGSDAYVSNKKSRKFHKSLGFKEAKILAHFIKKI